PKCQKKIWENIKCSECGEKLNDKYFSDRIIISIVLVLAVIILGCYYNPNLSWILNLPSDKYLFGMIAGIVGLILRNFIWFSENYPEKKAKWVVFTYLIPYPLFIVLSSLLISSVLLLNDKIESSPYLFFAFALPLNIYIGFATYEALEFLKNLIKSL
ncbi:MAG: hypothetical protein AAB593_01345, partial [Patescibacteria group bacterium]